MDLRTTFRNSVVTGLVLVAPLAVTIFVLQFVFGRLTALLDPIVQSSEIQAIAANDLLVAQALSALLVLSVITLLGFLAQRSGGDRVVDLFDRLFSLVPLVNVVYTSVRQVSDALVEGEGRYERVVLVEYPRLDVLSLGFVTGDGPAEADAVTGEPTEFVIVPHSPNPTAGQLVIVPQSNVHETDIPVRRAIRLLVTTGVAESEDELAELREEVDDRTAHLRDIGD